MPFSAKVQFSKQINLSMRNLTKNWLQIEIMISAAIYPGFPNTS